jgi:hypothetical protein
MEVVVKRKKSLPCLCWEMKPGHSAHSLVTILTELSWLHKNFATLSMDYFCLLIEHVISVHKTKTGI